VIIISNTEYERFDNPRRLTRGCERPRKPQAAGVRLLVVLTRTSPAPMTTIFRTSRYGWIEASEVRLKVPKLRQQTFETAIIERYRRRESSVEDALFEM
jgi:hypothetical protein